MIVFIDCHNLCHRALHTTGGLEYNGFPTGVIFGFLNQIFTFYRKMGPGWIPIFCWDKRPYIREIYYSQYKERKNELTEEQKEKYNELYFQIDQLRDVILPQLGWGNYIWKRDGFEADDLIAFGILKTHKYIKYIISGDEDLYQLLDEHTVIYKPGTNNIFKIEDFVLKYGIEPCLWPAVKSIAGCDSDNIKGVKGVGEATAIKYLKGELKTSTKAWKNIRQFDNSLNLSLVELPFSPCDSFTWNEWLFDTYNHANNPDFFTTFPSLQKMNFIEVFEQFGFDHFISHMHEISTNLFLY